MKLLESAAPYIIRLGCTVLCILAMMTIFVLLDVWRIERRTGRQINALAIGVLAGAVLIIGMLFSKCAITGCYPRAESVEACK